MSVVTGVLLCASLMDEDGMVDDCGCSAPDKINEWLVGKRFTSLSRLEQCFGGNKHPQLIAFGAGYNHFPEDDFAAFVMALPWQDPENVVLIMQPEEGPTRVFRPST